MLQVIISKLFAWSQKSKYNLPSQMVNAQDLQYTRKNIIITTKEMDAKHIGRKHNDEK